MPSNEKEINVNLIDRLQLVERVLVLAKKEHAEETVAFLEDEKKWIERKLY